MKPNNKLECYWISFPRDSNLVLGVGVTAFSEDDAFRLIEEQGIHEWYQGASEIKVERGVRIQDLDQNHVVPNMGPMQLRGVWYPAANIGFGAPRGPYYKPLNRNKE